MNSRAQLLGVSISRLSLDEALEACKQRAASGQGGYVCFVNVHTLTEGNGSPEFKRILESSFLPLADGVPLVWASRLKSTPISSRVCGPDFMTRFLKENPDLLHGFIGGLPGRAEKVAERFGLRAVCHSPPVRPFSPENTRDDWETFCRKCPDGKASSVVWVGLGAPKQEQWMEVAARLAPNTLFFGVGAAFDFLSGSKPRAPKWMQKTGLEWSHRLFSEPRRLWKRYLVTNSRFLYLLGQDLLKERQT